MNEIPPPPYLEPASLEPSDDVDTASIADASCGVLDIHISDSRRSAGNGVRKLAPPLPPLRSKVVGMSVEVAETPISEGCGRDHAEVESSMDDRLRARILVISDVHGDLHAVELLRRLVPGPFDAVVVAGDVAAAPGQVDLRSTRGRRTGHTRASATSDLREMLAMLTSYECPVCYVYGNHDGHIGYDADLGPGTHHLQNGPLTIERVSISGFSGCPWLWDENPHYLARRGTDEQERCRLALEDNRRKVAADVAGSHAPGRASLVVTHDRLTGCRGLFPVGTVFVHGHAHAAASNGPRAPYRVVRPGSLFQDGAVVPIDARADRWADRRWFKAGAFAILELAPAGLADVGHMRLSFDRTRWREVRDDMAPRGLPAEDARVERNGFVRTG